MRREKNPRNLAPRKAAVRANSSPPGHIDLRLGVLNRPIEMVVTDVDRLHALSKDVVRSVIVAVTVSTRAGGVASASLSMRSVLDESRVRALTNDTIDECEFDIHATTEKRSTLVRTTAASIH